MSYLGNDNNATQPRLVSGFPVQDTAILVLYSFKLQYFFLLFSCGTWLMVTSAADSLLSLKRGPIQANYLQSDNQLHRLLEAHAQALPV
jgi:hypothetical protein